MTSRTASKPVPRDRLLLRVAFAGLLLGTPAGWARCMADADVVEERLSLPVAVNGRAEKLEALLVRPAVGDHFPIALIVNGSWSKPRELHASDLAQFAHDFAHRGWLGASVMWRGYGTSSGVDQWEAGTCTAPGTGRFLDAHADDLAAALATLRARRDVDPAIALGVGVSIGGASMLDLAARSDRPLTAVINISGGIYLDAKPFHPDPRCGPFETDLVREFSSFGAAGVPTLWLYAKNDPWFRPQLVGRMLDAYRAGGGKVDFNMFPPFGNDGHTLFRQDASPLTQPAIDRFLRANQLPALAGDDAFAPLLAVLSSDDRHDVERYLRAPTEKALAIPETGAGLYWYFGVRSLGVARREALAYCRAESKEGCRVISENQTLLDTWHDVPARR